MAPPREPVPLIVTASFVLYLALAGWGLTELVSGVLYLAPWAWCSSPELLGAGMAYAGAFLAKFLVWSLLANGAYLALAIVMRRGRHWARVLLTLLSALMVVLHFAAPSLLGLADTGYYEQAFQWWSLVFPALNAIAVLLMYLTSSNNYFASARRIEVLNK